MYALIPVGTRKGFKHFCPSNNSVSVIFFCLCNAYKIFKKLNFQILGNKKSSAAKKSYPAAFFVILTGSFTPRSLYLLTTSNPLFILVNPL